MKKTILMGLAMLAFYGPANACNSDAIKTAQMFVTQAETDLEMGMVLRTDVYEAKSHLLEMKLWQTPNDASICKELVSSLTQVFDLIGKQRILGMRTMSEVVSAHNRLVEAQVKCK